MKMLNVRWRLTLWCGAVLLAIVAGFGTSVYLMMGRHLLSRTDFELDEELNELALEVRLAADEQDLKEQLQQRFFRHATYDLQVSRQGEPPLFRSERLQGASLPLPEQDGKGVSQPLRHRRGSLRESDPLIAERSATMMTNTSAAVAGIGEMRIASRRATGRSGEYLIQAAMPLTPLVRDMQAVRTMMLTAGSLAIIAALAGGYVLARRALAPVDRMTRLAEVITGTRLDSRLEVGNPDDELGHLARTINSMLDRLQQSVEELRRFTADAAHELRTPLAVLRTEAEVALRTPRTADEYRRVTEVTLDQSNRLTRLVERLLELSRRDCGLQPTRREEVPWHALLADVGEQFQGAAEQKGVSLTIEPSPGLTIPGDDVQLSQMLFNLIDNAVKFSDPGGAVFVRSEPVDGELHLTVSDTGIGIPPGDLPHVFNRFYRADKSRNGQTDGAGLGLAIAKAAVEAHHGTIRIESPPEDGTYVYVSLPLMPET